eukprot:tig00000215_g18637.t1
MRPPGPARRDRDRFIRSIDVNLQDQAHAWPFKIVGKAGVRCSAVSAAEGPQQPFGTLFRLPKKPSISIQHAFRNDFYQMPWDWGSANVIALADDRVKLYSPSRGLCTELDAFSAVDMTHARTEAMSTSYVTKGGVNALCWKSSGAFLAASTDEGQHEVRGFDLRGGARSSFCVRGHDGRVCGLQFHPEDPYLAASTNSGSIFVYDGRRLSSCLYRLRHEPSNAAIRGLAFSPCPGSSLLCSGGGTGDRTLRFWDLQTGTQVRRVDVCAQVTCLLWPDADRIVSAQGYGGNNTLVWDAKRMIRLGHLPGYPSASFKFIGLSPCGSLLATSGDGGTLDLWKAFPAKGLQCSPVGATGRVPSLRAVGLEMAREEERRWRGPLRFGPPAARST